MAQAQSIAQARDNPLNREGLCVLSLDGGGVRGLSSLLIIQALMAKVNAEREKDGHPSVKPCELFDLIGGTSTGGIIAIMLGRLEMGIDECIKAYTNMFQTIFTTRGRPISILGKIKGRFDSAVFEKCIGEILKERGLSDAELFNDGKERCKVVVCAKDIDVASTTLIRSYRSSDELNNIPATICQAVRATSAASSFFDPVTIQPYGRRFVDGGLGANNPVEQLWNEAQRIWCKDDRAELSDILKCFVSVGTGHPGTKALNEGAWKFFRETLVSIATETEHTAKLFLERHLRLYESKRYFRFNVQQGLQGIELQEYQAVGRIASATAEYMDGQETRSAARDCAMNLKQKQSHLDLSPNLKSIIKWNSNARFRGDGQKPITFIPYNRNDNLVNRDDAFKALDGLFALPTRNLPISIWGLGGCGKTQIGIEYAYRRQEETSCSIFWVHADSEANFTKDYSDLGKIAGLSPDLKGEDLLQAVQQWMEKQENWLLVLDNADDLAIFNGDHSASQVHQIRGPELQRFVPRSQMGTVLWISRDGGIVGSITAVNREVKVGAMTIHESCELFQRLSGQDDAELSLNEEKLLELLELIERLPLAIVQAASYIRKTKVSIKQYLKFYNETESRQSNLLKLEYQEAYRSEVPKSVMHTWLISMAQIAKESPCSEKILRTIAFFDNSRLPIELISAAAGPDFDEDEVLLSAGRLMEYSFLQGHKAIEKDFPDYGQHRLVQLAMRQSLSATQTRSFSGDVLRIMCMWFPGGQSHKNWSTCRLYLPHALKIIEWEEAEGYDRLAPQILQSIGIYCKQVELSSEGERANLKLLKMREEALGSEHPLTIDAMQSLAGTWCRMGRFTEAGKLQAKVLHFWRAVGETNPSTMIAKLNLASTWEDQGLLDEAERLKREVVEQQKEVLGDRNPDEILISAMGNLASSWLSQGKLLAAEDLNRQVRKLREEAFGQRHPDTARAMANLAASWYEQGRLDDAAQLQTTVLELQTEILGEEHPNTITAMANLATTRNHQGRLDESEELQIKVLRLRRELLVENHPDTIMAMANLAATSHLRGKLDEAERQEREVLDLRQEVLGKKHPDTITAMANLAVTIGLQKGRFGEAEELETEVLKLQKEVLGDKHPSTITAMANLAATYLQRGRPQETKELLAKVLELRKEVLGDAHPHTVQAEADLELITRALDRVHQGASSKQSHSRRKIWRRNFTKWGKSEDG